MIMSICCLYFPLQELVDGGLLDQLSPPTSDLVSVLTQLIVPPTEIDGSLLKKTCAQINKAMEVLNDILLDIVQVIPYSQYARRFSLKMRLFWKLYDNCIPVRIVLYLWFFISHFQRYGGLSSFLGSDCITPSWKMEVWALLEALCCILSLTSIIYDWFLANCQEDWQNTAGVSCDGLSYRLAGSSNIPFCFKVKRRSAEPKGLGFDAS